MQDRQVLHSQKAAVRQVAVQRQVVRQHKVMRPFRAQRQHQPMPRHMSRQSVRLLQQKQGRKSKQGQGKLSQHRLHQDLEMMMTMERQRQIWSQMMQKMVQEQITRKYLQSFDEYDILYKLFRDLLR